MTIKVIEGLEPLEVMKAASEGKRVARLNECYVPARWVEWHGQKPTLFTMAQAVDNGYKIAIIDDSQPELTAEWWRGFDWEFFNQWDGVHIQEPEEVRYQQRHWTIQYAPLDNSGMELTKSPPYPWFGGKQPVPDNVEVEVICRDDTNYVGSAKEFARDWKRHTIKSALDIIAFRLTGRVL